MLYYYIISTIVLKNTFFQELDEKIDKIEDDVQDKTVGIHQVIFIIHLFIAICKYIIHHFFLLSNRNWTRKSL